MRTLRLFNGRAGSCCDWKDQRWKTTPRSDLTAHAYIAAYSMADAVRVVKEYSEGRARTSVHEINIYWNKNCWGNSMDGITPERGLWVLFDYPRGKPVCLYKGEPK